MKMLEKLNSMSLDEIILAYEKTCNWKHPDKEKVLSILNEYVKKRFGTYYLAYMDFTFSKFEP